MKDSIPAIHTFMEALQHGWHHIPDLRNEFLSGCHTELSDYFFLLSLVQKMLKNISVGSEINQTKPKQADTCRKVEQDRCRSSCSPQYNAKRPMIPTKVRHGPCGKIKILHDSCHTSLLQAQAGLLANLAHDLNTYASPH